jgi:hypothetical protein
MASVKDFSVEEKLTALVNLQKIDCKLDEIQILKGELPIEVKDLEDEIEGLHARQTRVEEEINGIQEFINQKIYKIKHIHSSDPENYDVYIFVGDYYDKNINNLFEKIENNDYKSLTDDENKKLSLAIPNFRAKFGKIKVGNTYFVKDLIAGLTVLLKIILFKLIFSLFILN